MDNAGRTTARRSGLLAASIGALGALVAIARPEKACPPNYVHLLPLRWASMIVTALIALLGAAVVSVARFEGPHRVAATMGFVLAIVATLATIATIALAAGGFDSCWTF